MFLDKFELWIAQTVERFFLSLMIIAIALSIILLFLSK